MVQLRILILILSLSALACSKATPEFDLLDPNAIPQPKFSGATTKSINSSSDTDTYAINGECDPKIKSITAKVINVSTDWEALDNIATSSATVLCSTAGTFSFTLKGLAALGFTATEGTTYEIQLRGFTSAGNSNPSSIKIRYASPVGAPHLLLAGGGVHGGADNANRMMSATFQMEVRMSHIHSQSLSSTSTNFAVKVGSPARY